MFKTLRVNSLKRGASRHVQPSLDRVNINHRWNIFHSPDTFYLIQFNLKEGKVKLKIIVFITVESVWESSNDAGMPWIRNKCYFNQNLPHGRTKKKTKNIVNLYYFLDPEIGFYAMVRWVNQLQRMQQQCGSRTWQDRRQDRTDHLRVPVCASEIGLHFRPACSLPPFILNGALGLQKPHCVSGQSSSPEGLWGSSFGPPQILILLAYFMYHISS